MRDLLKFITCGSVDDGKSTLIGHMLYDAKLLFADQARALALESKAGSRGGALDYSLLLDGLMAEREQGITIDVAYRYFTTEKRAFIVADCPGHEQYTRNMAVGASFAELAVLLVDVQRGVTLQTKRHARICALMGIRHFVLAVNKMDLCGYDRQRFDEVRQAFLRYAADFPAASIAVIPVSATEGDNLVARSPRTPWYEGEALLPYLESADVGAEEEGRFYLPVQRVCRPDHRFRGFQGQVESGAVSTGDAVTVLPSGETARVKELLVAGRASDEAAAGQAVTLALDREVDVSRGCVLADAGAPLSVSSLFTATLLWMDDAPLAAGRSYLARCGTKTLPATVLTIKHRIELETGGRVPVRSVFRNELAYCDIALSEPLVFGPFQSVPGLGSFLLIDRVTNATAACGVIEHSLRRADNVVWEKLDITRTMRAEQKNQRPLTLWFTGLSGAGKSALANELEKLLFARGLHTMLLDGDNLRHGLNRDLGFTEADRVENVRRVAEVARLLNDAGVIVLAALISPYRRDRDRAGEIIGDAFREIYVSTPLAVCEERDVKGLYRKARAGKIPSFTGVTGPYEPPEAPAYAIDTTGVSPRAAAEILLRALF